jgi:hypothetical protein
MRDRDSLILESLYSKIIKESAYLEKWNNYSDEEKKRIEKHYPWMVPNWSDDLIIPDRIKSYFPDNTGFILKSQVAEAFWHDAIEKEIKCPYKIYQIFALDSKNYSSEPDWDEQYLIQVEGKGLEGNHHDPVDMARKNKDVNVLTIMNQILYPIKDMDQNYFNGLYENLFRTMVVEDSNPKDKRAYLFTNKNSQYAEPLRKYFGKRGYSIHRNFLIVLSRMIVDQFGDDENLKDENGKMDYSHLLTLAAFAY